MSMPQRRWGSEAAGNRIRARTLLLNRLSTITLADLSAGFGARLMARKPSADNRSNQASDDWIDVSYGRALVSCMECKQLNDHHDTTCDGYRIESAGMGNRVVCGLVMFDDDNCGEADFQEVKECGAN